MKGSKDFVAILQVTSPTIDGPSFLATHPELKSYDAWRPGDVHVGRRKHEDGGFKLDLASGSKWETVVGKIIDAVSRIAPALRAARSAGAALFLDVGVMADAREWGVVNTCFSPEELAVLSKLGIQLNVSSFLAVRIERPATRARKTKRPKLAS